jgi:hypothetical protein
MAETMRSRIAEAIARSAKAGEDFGGMSVAALKALREPTAAMIEATNFPNTDRNSSVDEIFQVMIDKAIVDG